MRHQAPVYAAGADFFGPFEEESVAGPAEQRQLAMSLLLARGPVVDQTGGMTRSQLIDVLARRLRLDRAVAEAAVHTVFQTMRGALKEGRPIELRGFGSFGVRKASPYRGRNPRSGALVEVGERRVPWFKVGRPLRARIAGTAPAAKADEGAPEHTARPLAARRGAE